jgi:Ca2+-transporting ATPase
MALINTVCAVAAFFIAATAMNDAQAGSTAAYVVIIFAPVFYV